LYHPSAILFTMSLTKTTLVLGASRNPDRVSYQAIKLLKQKNIPLIAIGKRDYKDHELKIIAGMPKDIGYIHTITLYLGPSNQKEYYDYILSLNPERIIFNPGTINHELAELAQEQGIEVIEGCMLVMLKTGQF
jgi:predicted CoA-binding protein